MGCLKEMANVVYYIWLSVSTGPSELDIGWCRHNEAEQTFEFLAAESLSALAAATDYFKYLL